jgi:hypothetical protein
MIVREFYRTRNDGVNLYKTYSNENFLIKKVGTEEIYAEAIDVENAPYTYEETDKLIDVESEFTDAEFRTMIEEAVE